ncbi:MAG: prephenate dehydrogenase [bacterium]|mgnify:CR=1 FL=1|jgi:prephenate dehydrogenase
MRLVQRMALIGTGLIGGSLALDWLATGAVAEVVGWDIDTATLTLALERGIIQYQASSPEEAVHEAELVLVATPVQAACDLAARLGPILKRGQVIADVGSVKAPVLNAWTTSLPPGVDFVGGHPLAGAETSGSLAARRGLFHRAKYILTPSASCRADSVALVAELVRRAGAEPVLLSAAEHDQLVAATSHLPHLSAVTLVKAAAELASDFSRYSAGGFADTTRVALGSPVMWRDICLANKQAILTALDHFSEQLMTIRSLIAASAGAELETLFAQAQATRSQFKSARGR